MSLWSIRITLSSLELEKAIRYNSDAGKVRLLDAHYRWTATERHLVPNKRKDHHPSKGCGTTEAT